MCIETGIPSIFCGGFYNLSEEKQIEANNMALKYLNIWREKYNLSPLTLDEAQPKTKANLY